MVTAYQTPERIKLKFDAIKEEKKFWKGKTILDIGCNEGMLYPLLKECEIKSYTGIDNSDEYIFKASLRYPDARFLLADLRTFNETFDIGIALSTLHIFNSAQFEIILAHYAKLCPTFIFEVPVKGESKLYFTRPEWENISMASAYFKRVICYGVSPSPHDTQSIRKVFKCEN